MATCKGCVHYKLCGVFGYVFPVESCGFYTDRSRFVELPTAHWSKHTPDKNIMQEFHNQGIGRGMSENSIFWTCSNCGGWGTLIYKYCPHCGAKIEEAERALKLKERENNAN